MAANAWFAITAFSLFMYVALDGYDLGIGVLLLGQRDDRRRREMVDLVATAWDGNESWLVLVGISLFGGLAGAYARLLPALYVPLIVMLFALIFRGLAVELIDSRRRFDRRWGVAFAAGSLVAAFSQGVVLAAIAKGLPVSSTSTAGVGTWTFLSWYSVLGGLTAVALFCMAGAAWMDYKADGPLQRQAQRAGRVLTPVAAALVALSAVLLPVASTGLHSSGARLWVVGWCALVAAAALAVTWWSFGRDVAWRASAAVVGAEAVGLGGLVALRAPDIVPNLTIAQAASPTSSLNFLLVGVGLAIPITLVYNAYAFWVFRGRYRPEDTGPLDPAGRVVRPAPGLGAPSGASSMPDANRRSPSTPPPLPFPAGIVVAVVLAVVIFAVYTVVQNIYAAHGTWIGILGVCLVMAGALVAWYVGDRRHPPRSDVADLRSDGGRP